MRDSDICPSRFPTWRTGNVDLVCDDCFCIIFHGILLKENVLNFNIFCVSCFCVTWRYIKEFIRALAIIQMVKLQRKLTSLLILRGSNPFVSLISLKMRTARRLVECGQMGAVGIEGHLPKSNMKISEIFMWDIKSGKKCNIRRINLSSNQLPFVAI